MADNDIAKNVEKVISDLGEDKKAQITEWILQMGIRRDDPLFNLYAELGTTQSALQRLPDKLDTIIVGWTDMVDSKLNDATKVAIQQQKSAIADAAKELVKKAGSGNFLQLGSGLSNWQLAQVAGVLGFVLALGTGIGVFTYKTVADSSFSQGVTRTSVLKPEDQKLLNWVKSREGQLARKIYQKNAPIIKTCRQTKRNEGCIIVVN